MKDKIALLLAGLVAGALIASLVPAQAHHRNDLTTLNRKVRQLQAKTRLMDANGFYNGPVFGWQVVSACEDGATATWKQIPVAGLEDFRYLYDCADEEVSAPHQLRKQAHLILKALKR